MRENYSLYNFQLNSSEVDDTRAQNIKTTQLSHSEFESLNLNLQTQKPFETKPK